MKIRIIDLDNLRTNEGLCDLLKGVGLREEVDAISAALAAEGADYRRGFVAGLGVCADASLAIMESIRERQGTRDRDLAANAGQLPINGVEARAVCKTFGHTGMTEAARAGNTLLELVPWMNTGNWRIEAGSAFLMGIAKGKHMERAKRRSA